MRYRNLKTRAIFDSPCAISGGDWVAEEIIIAIKTEVNHVEVEVKEKIEKVEVPEESIEGITVKEIKQKLDTMGIKYDPKAKKQELYNLMFGK